MKLALVRNGNGADVFDHEAYLNGGARRIAAISVYIDGRCGLQPTGSGGAPGLPIGNYLSIDDVLAALTKAGFEFELY